MQHHSFNDHRICLHCGGAEFAVAGMNCRESPVDDAPREPDKRPHDAIPLDEWRKKIERTWPKVDL